MRRMCESAGIEGRFTNHSLRATMATRGLTKGIVAYMKRTGHRDSRSSQRYQRPSLSTKLEISKAFESGPTIFTKAEEKDSEEFCRQLRREVHSDEGCNKGVKKLCDY